MDQTGHAMALCSQCYSAGAFDVNGPVRLCGRLCEDADQVDDSIRSCDRLANAFVVQYIGLNNHGRFGRFSLRVDPAGVPHGHAHRHATLQKERHEMTADEAVPPNIVMQGAITSSLALYRYPNRRPRPRLR